MRKGMMLLVFVCMLAACGKSPSADLLMRKSYEKDMNQATSNELLAGEIEKSKPLVDLNL